jgi:hypothetical protein
VRSGQPSLPDRAESGRVSSELLHLALDNLADSVTIHDAEGRLRTELVERLDRRLLDFQDSDQRDDVAVLVLRRLD